jgi:hypothetical protein
MKDMSIKTESSTVPAEAKPKQTRETIIAGKGIMK